MVPKGLQNKNAKNNFNSNHTGLSLKPTSYKTNKLNKGEKFITTASVLNQDYKSNFVKKFAVSKNTTSKMTLLKSK